MLGAQHGTYLSRCRVHRAHGIDLDNNGTVVIHIHQTAHGRGERHIHLIVFVADVESLAAFSQNANHYEGHTIDHQTLPERRGSSEQIDRNRVAYHSDPRATSLLR